MSRRMSRRKGLMVLMSALLAFTMILSACSKGTDSTSNTTEPPKQETPAATEIPKLEPVELTWYYPNSLTNLKDLELVQAEMNKIITAKINATIKLNPIDWGAYQEKMNVMTGAGEKYDLVFTAPWFNNYFQNVAKGALLPLDDLLDKYAPTFKSMVPQAVWDATRVNGKIYGAINWQIVAMPYGTTIPKQYVDKYNVNVDALQKYEDFEPYLAAWKESHPPLSYNQGEPFNSQPPYFGMDSIGADTSVGWVRLDDPEMKVVNQFATNEFKQFAELMHKWYQAGYFPKDNALRTNEQLAAEGKAGKPLFFTIGAPVKPGVEAEAKASGGGEIAAKALSKAVITTGRAIATMTGISKTSDNPERAMMFLELINTDKDLYNLLANGIEGKHYKKVADNVIEKVAENNGYNPNTDWMFGNQFNGYYTTPSAVGNWEKTIDLNNNAANSPILGFNFDPESLKTELAQTDAVWQQYKAALSSGTVDPAKVLPEFLDKLNKAGADKVIAEKQRQIDEWKKTKK